MFSSFRLEHFAFCMTNIKVSKYNPNIQVYHRSERLIILFGIIFSFVLFEVSDGSQCPSQCICVPDRMQCETTGLQQLPPPYTSNLLYLVVQNQTFQSTHLGQTELKLYRSVQFGGSINLKELFIRNCNIQTIGPEAFSQLGSQLQKLDLTGNPLNSIGDYAFSGLGQPILIFDEIKAPVFSKHAFTGIKRIKSLIMRQSGLTALPYEQLVGLASEGKLTELLLKGNRLQTLEAKYDDIFKHLQDFELSDNPWHCDCQLTWLIRRYKHTRNSRKQPYRQRRELWSDQPATNWDEVENQPQCASPPSLVGRYFSELITDSKDVYGNMLDPVVHGRQNPTIIYCPPPQVKFVDIDLRDIYGQSPTREKNTKTRLQTVPSSNNTLKVKLKCVLLGSSDLLLSWRHHTPNKGWQLVPNDTVGLQNYQYSHINKSAMSTDPWITKLNKEIHYETSISVEQAQDIDMYSCLGHDVLGNVSVSVRIHWPKIVESVVKNYPQLPKEHSNKTEPIKIAKAEFDDASEYERTMFAKRFNLVHLLVAIGVTFVSTLFLFLIAYRTWNCQLRIKAKMKPNKSDIGSPTPIKSSPGETASSNTSSFDHKALLHTKRNEEAANVPFSHPTPMQNPHTYSQFLNGHVAISKPYPIPFGVDFVANPTLQASGLHNHQFSAGSTVNNTVPMSAYEPPVYADANNFPYDHLTLSMTPAETNQRTPLIQNSVFTNTNNALRQFTLPTPNTVQNALVIPPPPTIPQPSLPSTSSLLNLTGSSTMSPTIADNLLLLQSGFPQLINNNNTTHHLVSNPIKPVIYPQGYQTFRG